MLKNRFDRETCRELQQKARRWAREASDREDRRLAERLEAEFRALDRELGRGGDGRS